MSCTTNCSYTTFRQDRASIPCTGAPRQRAVYSVACRPEKCPQRCTITIYRCVYSSENADKYLHLGCCYLLPVVNSSLLRVNPLSAEPLSIEIGPVMVHRMRTHTRTALVPSTPRQHITEPPIVWCVSRKSHDSRPVQVHVSQVFPLGRERAIRVKGVARKPTWVFGG